MRLWVSPLLSLTLALAAFAAGPVPARASDATEGRFARQEGSLRLREALGVLERVSSGRELLAKARKHWGSRGTSDLLEHLRRGGESKTDAVITRYFNPKTGQEHRERRVVIYLRTEQRLEDLVLDLAHELVHAVSRPAWDPYDPSLTHAEYIRVAIEGEGGEVEAVVAECRVGLEMAALSGSSLERCRHYVTPGSTEVSVEKVTRDFYRVGKWRPELARLLGSDNAKLLSLSAEAPVLFSSTGRTPYPVALYREFEQITEIACENSRRRQRARSVRGPAQTEVSHFLNRRCN
ncbi:MAG: hypothetical protein NDJ90_04150 [Oligoflexia bacterium]|nr:hypothetical protein [Oligoflexia bacterium]